MKINEAGLALIKSFEGCKLKAYKDSVGIWTIGYGHIEGVAEGLTCSQEQADTLLRGDLARIEAGVSKAVCVPLTENQFSALVCFAFNVGVGSLNKSTLLKKLNAHNMSEAAEQFLVWNKAGGKVLKGLTTRRTAERALFIKG